MEDHQRGEDGHPQQAAAAGCRRRETAARAAASRCSVCSGSRRKRRLQRLVHGSSYPRGARLDRTDACRRHRARTQAVVHRVADLSSRRRQPARLLHHAGADLRRRQFLPDGGRAAVSRQRATADPRRARHAQPQLHQEPRARAQQAAARPGAADQRRRDAPAAAAADAAGLPPRSHRRTTAT